MAKLHESKNPIVNFIQTIIGIYQNKKSALKQSSLTKLELTNSFYAKWENYF